MPSIASRVANLWNTVAHSEAQTREHFQIPPSQIESSSAPGTPFEPKRHYFQVILNEMYLEHDREWFATYDPMAFVACSFVYENSTRTIPTVIGPQMLEQYKQAVPRGMIFRNTPAMTLNPYVGGPVTITMILGKIQRDNYADRLLSVIEKLSSALVPSTATATYIPIAEAVMEGVETLLGLSETESILGYNVTYNPVEGENFAPGYFALLDTTKQIDRSRVWVKESRLYAGATLDDAKPYTDSDFAVFSIARATRRTDENLLPFYPIWQTTRDLAARTGDHFWQEAKANFNTVKRSILLSPDLTTDDSKDLRSRYLAELKDIRTEAALEGNLAAAVSLSDEEAELAGMAAELNQLDEL
jgi:hypothetical protein